MFIVSLTYKTDMESVERVLAEHITYIEKYFALKKFIVSGRKVPRTGGIILVNANNRAEVEEIVKEDPFYQADVADFDIIEFAPTKALEEFAGLTRFV